MTDRVPGAPGQYKAVVTEAELLKMQSGEEFTITMTRDDQPITEGTPYSKAAVLPDELAQLICPDMEDPTPADALAALLPLRGGAMTGNIDMGGNTITGLAVDHTPSDAAEVATCGLVIAMGVPARGTIGVDAGLNEVGQGYAVISSSNPVYIGSYKLYSGHVLTFSPPGQTTKVQLILNSDGYAFFRVAWFGQSYGNWHKLSTEAVAVAEE